VRLRTTSRVQLSRERALSAPRRSSEACPRCASQLRPTDGNGSPAFPHGGTARAFLCNSPRLAAALLARIIFAQAPDPRLFVQRFLGAGILGIWAKKVEGAYCEESPRHLRPGRKAHMKTLPESSRVVRCMRCRDPINQPIGGDGQSATHCARCAPTIASRESRIDRIRAAALAAKAARMRALPPLPNRSGLRHV
jgi:hypothetical protein